MSEIGFREFVAGGLLILFAWAFYLNPHDEIIIGALLTGFAAAWGFYLGGSKVGSDTAAKNADTVAAQAQAATDTATTKPAPASAASAADQVADAAVERAEEIRENTDVRIPE
jgi:hypothetical protein